MKKTQKQTIYDIAQQAGASASTVSSALNGTWKARRIREETVNRIKRIAREQGYSVNLQARGLRKARSGLVGMILPEHDNRFFSSLSQSFSAEAWARGLCPAIISTGRDPDEESQSVANLISYAIDSLFIVGASDPEALSELCRSANLPHVFVDQPCKLAPSVISDNFSGAEGLTKRLLAAMPAPTDDPRSWLYFLGGDASLYATSQRIVGFRAGWSARRGPADENQVIACGYDRVAARIELERLYERLGGLPGGLLINSLRCFEGVLEFLAGLPESDIQSCTLGCYDYDPFGSLLRFPVHMVRQRSNALMAEAYRCLDAGTQDPKLIMIKPDYHSPQ